MAIDQAAIDKALSHMPGWATEALKRFDIVAEEARGSSDRAAAIVLAAALEEMLRKVMVNYLPETGVQLRSFISPGKFSQLTDFAEITGVIPARLASSLRSINDVRAKFAHRVLENPSFDGHELKEAIQKLKHPLNVINDQNRTPRESFLFFSSMAFLQLVMLSGFTERLGKPHPGMHADEVIDLARAPSEDELKEMLVRGAAGQGPRG